MFNYENLNSSVIRSLVFDYDDGEVRVQFHSGRWYGFRVSEEFMIDFESVVVSEQASIGQYFNTHIRNLPSRMID